MKLMVLDGNSVINRAYYGVRALTTKDGFFTNAIYGFLNILEKLRTEEQPDALCVTFDLKAPTFRHLAYDSYKATRHPMPDELAMQLPMMKDILRAMRERALVDPSFRQAILATRNAADPLTALCELAQANGFNLTLADIISDGEEFSCNQTKSTNGGNPMPYDCFDDSYEMFLLSL